MARRLIGALLASQHLAAARPFGVARRKLGYVITDSNIRAAVSAWLSNSASAESTYGHISTWATGAVTDMSNLFHYQAAASFNEDIGAWDTSGVTTMYRMFLWASAFDQDLGWCVDDGVDLDRAFRNTPCRSTSCGVTRKNEFDECEAIVDDDAYDIFVVDDDKDDDDDYDDDDDCGYGSLCNDAATTRSAALAALVIGAAL